MSTEVLNTCYEYELLKRSKQIDFIPNLLRQDVYIPEFLIYIDTISGFYN